MKINDIMMNRKSIFFFHNIVIIIFLFMNCSLNINAKLIPSDFWGTWELNSDSSSIKLIIKEKGEVTLLINNKIVKRTRFDFFSSKLGGYKHFFISWEGGYYGEFSLDLMPLNQDGEIENEYLIGILSKFILINNSKETGKLENIPVKFFNKKRKEQKQEIFWNSIGVLYHE